MGRHRRAGFRRLHHRPALPDRQGRLGYARADGDGQAGGGRVQGTGRRKARRRRGAEPRQRQDLDRGIGRHCIQVPPRDAGIPQRRAQAPRQGDASPTAQTAVRKRLVVLDTKAPTISILRPSDNGRYNGVISIEGIRGRRERPGGGRGRRPFGRQGFLRGARLHPGLVPRRPPPRRYPFRGGPRAVVLRRQRQAAGGTRPGFRRAAELGQPVRHRDCETPAAELSRFGGYVLGARLLANLAYLPFSYWFGPDWDFFSMSFAIGASFTYFSQRMRSGILFSPPDGKYMVLSGVVGQWEFAKFDFGWPLLKSFGSTWRAAWSSSRARRRRASRSSSGPTSAWAPDRPVLSVRVIGGAGLDSAPPRDLP